MKVYRFKIWFEDYPDVQREIDIRGDQTFEDLHQAILKSVGFDNQQLASFFMWDNDANEQIEITLIEMGLDEGGTQLIMDKSIIEDFAKRQGDVLRYEYDFVLLWSFLIELNTIRTENGEIDYPQIVESVGDAPDQYETVEKYPEPITEDDEKLIDNMKRNKSGFFEDTDEAEGEDWEIRDMFDDLEGGFEEDDKL